MPGRSDALGRLCIISKVMNNNYKFKVFPVTYVKGFVATYCHTMECAMKCRKQMERATGVEWRVRNIQN